MERILKAYARKDSRIRYKILGENLGISGNTTYIIKGLVILVACAIDMRKYLAKK